MQLHRDSPLRWRKSFCITFREAITDFWRMQVSEWEQPRWAYLFDEGLIDAKTAYAWADEVWCSSEEDTDEEEEM
jgi:hypothetical protein